MQGTRFDAFTRWTAQRFTRRAAVTTAGAGLATVALGAAGLGPAVAQVATPVPNASPAATVPVSLLFVQFAGVTTLTPGIGDVHTLTMTEVQAQTVYFSDRPNRVAGAKPTATFVDGFAQTFATSAPNATLIGHVERGDHQEEAVVLTLLSAAYDETTATLTYEVMLLDADLITDVTYEHEPLTLLDTAREYAEVSLFIDSAAWDAAQARCDDCYAACGNNFSSNAYQACMAECQRRCEVYFDCANTGACGDWTSQPAPSPYIEDPTPAPAPDDSGECGDPRFDCQGASWDCVCNGSISMACGDGVWDTEPGTDCCPASCEVNGWEATEPGVFIPEKDCCTEQG